MFGLETSGHAEPASRVAQEGSAKPLLHIGYVKTGSSWLQTHVFGTDDYGYRSVVPLRDVREIVVEPSPFTYEPARFRDRIGPGLEQAACAGVVPVITSERLAGNPISGGVDSRLIADRLKRSLPDARVLIVVREQRSMVVSCYSQYVREGGSGSIAGFLQPPPGAQFRRFEAAFLEYHRLVEHYRGLYGARNVLVLCYEQLREAPVDFVRRIARFAGAPEPGAVPETRCYVSPPAVVTAILSVTNLILHRGRLNPGGWIHAPRLSRAIGGVAKLTCGWCANGPLARHYGRTARDFAGTRYVDSNQVLQEYTECDMRRLGYML